MTAFEDFVNTELPLRTNITALPTASRYARFTGVGRAVEERTPAQVLSDIAAAALAHASTHTPGGADVLQISATDKLLGRAAGGGDVVEIPCTAAGRALIDDADAAAQRTTLNVFSQEMVLALAVWA